MDWFLLALLSPLLFAIVNLIDDNLVHHVYKTAYFGAIISGLFGALPLLALFFGDLQATSLQVKAFGILAGFLTTVYYYLYFKALQHDVPSVNVALYSLAPAIIPFLAYAFLGERLLAQQLIGFVIVMLASFGLALTEVKKFKFSKALIPMSAAALLFAISTVLLKYVYQNTNFFTGYMMFSLGMGLAGGYFWLILSYKGSLSFIGELRQNSKKIIGFFIVAETISIMAEFTQNLALERGPVSLVTAIGGIQSVYVLIIALLFYRFTPKYFREAAEGGIIKKFSLMFIIIGGLYLIMLET